jgi:hypothetical protein
MGRATELLNVVNLTIPQFSINQQSLCTDLKMSTVMEQLEAIKNQVCKALSFVMMLLMVVMTSCGNSEDEEVRQENISSYMTESAMYVTMSYASYVGGLSFDVTITPKLNLDALKLDITSIDIYRDDFLITSLTQSPYTYKANLKLDAGDHELIFITNFKDRKNGNKYAATNIEKIHTPSGEYLDGKDLGIGITFNSTSKGNDKVDIRLSVYQIILSDKYTEEGWYIDSLEYYFDGVLIQLDESDSYEVTDYTAKSTYVFTVKATLKKENSDETKILEVSREL